MSPPIVISYRPKSPDYLPAVVGSIRNHLGDWPIVLVCEREVLPPQPWLEKSHISVISDWSHTAGANKVRRLWDHAEIISAHFDQWLWWHDDMLLLRALEDPIDEFSKPRVREQDKERPNKKLGNWHVWLWDTLNFFKCQSISAPNPVLHVPRVINRASLSLIPPEWDRNRLLFEPTYLLWHWHINNITPQIDAAFRCAMFKGEVDDLSSLEHSGATIFCWGQKIDHLHLRKTLSKRYPLDFGSE